MDIRLGRRDPWPLVGVVCAIAFFIVAGLVTRRGTLPFDEAFAATIQGLAIPRVFWEACSRAGGGTLVVVGVASVLIAIVARRPRLALVLAVTMIASALFTDIVKDYVARPRPPGALLIETSGFSFPSGHALNSTTTYGLLAVVVWRSGLPHALRMTAAVIGVTLPTLVGLSRIALDVHYPSDVLGGWLAGVAFMALAATLILAADAMGRVDLRPPPPVRDEGPSDGAMDGREAAG